MMHRSQQRLMRLNGSLMLGLVLVCGGISSCTSVSPQPSVDQIKAKAENGDFIAQLTLGCMYNTGKGIKKDEAQAARWFRAVATHKPPSDPDELWSLRGRAWLASDALAGMYEEGRGVKKDLSAAAYWKRRAEYFRETAGFPRFTATTGTTMTADGKAHWGFEYYLEEQRLRYVLFSGPTKGNVAQGHVVDHFDANCKVKAMLTKPDGGEIDLLHSPHQLYQLTDGRLLISNERVTGKEFLSFLDSSPKDYTIAALLRHAKALRKVRNGKK